ncbi:unnamed protein product [Brassica oleracea]
MANLVGRIVTPNIEDAVYKLGDKLEERLAKLIKAENGRGCTSAGASLLTADAIRSEGQTTATYVPTSLHNSTEQPLVDLATVIPKQAEKVGEPLQAEKVGEPIQLDNLINMVITDVGGVLDDSEVAPANNQPSIHITVGPVAECVKTLEDAAHSPTDTDLTTPQPGQNTNFTHHHLSPVDEDGSPHEKEGELLHEEVCHASVPDVEASNVIAETRKSKRTRILPPLFNDYQCDPKIKAFSHEGTLTTTSNNIDEIYMAMRERAGDSRYKESSQLQQSYSNRFRSLSIRSEDKGSSLQAMHKYGKVKSFRLVKHIGKGFAIALLEGASRGYAFVEYESEKELCRAYEDAHHSFIDGREIIVDYKRQQLMP